MLKSNSNNRNVSMNDTHDEMILGNYFDFIRVDTSFIITRKTSWIFRGTY